VEARSRGQSCWYLGEGEGQERIGRCSLGNTMFAETDFPDAQTLGAAAVSSNHWFAGGSAAAMNGMKGWGAVRWSPLPGRETL
jgi:hypothetical protein